MEFFRCIAYALPVYLLSCVLLAAAIAQLIVPCLSAQTPIQQRLYGSSSVTTTTSSLSGYSKNDMTGALSVLPAAPFADRLEGGLVAIDGQGKFLFVLNSVSNNISMYQIDASTGALAEVPNSPFAAGPTINPNLAPSLPISLTAEKNGNFLYVGHANGDSSTTSAVVPFAIDAASLRLGLTPQLSLDFGNGAPIQMLADPKGLRLYVGFGPGGNQIASSAGAMVFSIDPANGVLASTGNAGGGSAVGRAIAIDPQGRFFFDSWGQNTGTLDSGVISPVDGTSNANSTVDLGANVFASSLLVESSGKFLYAQTQAGLMIFSIDQSTGALTPAGVPLTSPTLAKGTSVADPTGPFIYSLTRAGVDVFQVDPQTGVLTEIPGAPFGSGAPGAVGSLGLAILESAAGQNVSGPAAQLFPTSADFGQTTVGKTSPTKIISLVNAGDQILGISGIAITGANAGDFAQSSTCGATLAANANCSISVLFTPSQSGLEQATLQVTDNAAGSPQGVALTGTGVATTPGVTISPSLIDFGTISEGGTIAPQAIQFTNSGTAVFHVSAIALSGSNPSDFSQTSTCLTAPVAVQSSCVITVNFTPKTQGKRTASLVITDDAPNSPHSVSLSGTLASAFQLSVAPTGSTSAAVSAGQTAQYALQLAPGPGFTGIVTISCSGAPTAATCSANPGLLTVTNANSIPFQMAVATSGSASLPPAGFPFPPWWILRTAGLLSLVGLLVCLMKAARPYGMQAAFRYASLAIIVGFLLLPLAGCGGRSTITSAVQPTPTPPPGPSSATTPAGITTITVTATSGTLTPQTIQLTLTVH